MYRRIVIIALIIILFVISLYYFERHNVQLLLSDQELLKNRIASLGWFGPVMIVSLMTVAIVMSPLPSAPIALTAGLLYGHTWGTVYVLIGSTLGAIIAFSIARLLGYDFIRHWLGENIAKGWAGSQNTLMGIVFVSRLMPFISFDIVSYIAGFTSLSFWRFTIATVAGIAPASFLLAHLGGELSTSDNPITVLLVIGIGLLMMIPVLFKSLGKR
ncbi:MAG: TVP38/TMEM64 family protein [Gammaproteobacteria bacterium]|nr:TVP38/TMEM64 family protein [Gammaproteobacteria bacterium]